MLACLDTDYKETKGQCACVLFKNWTDEQPFKSYTSVLDPIAPYEPGAFYKRELPCILHTLKLVQGPLEVLVIDGNVWLGEDQPGLGWHLYEALSEKVPIIGVAKTKFHEVEKVASTLLRGESKNPLWVTAIGVDLQVAVRHIEAMKGDYRIPTLLKAVDTVCRHWG